VRSSDSIRSWLARAIPHAEQADGRSPWSTGLRPGARPPIAAGRSPKRTVRPFTAFYEAELDQTGMDLGRHRWLRSRAIDCPQRRQFGVGQVGRGDDHPLHGTGNIIGCQSSVFSFERLTVTV